jgi:DNA-binding NarL/FixJ family response regulator
MRVLVVDDYEPLRHMARAVLTTPDFTVVGDAPDGAAALEAARRLEPDIVLLDYQMPRGDGISVARALKRRARPPRIVLWTSEPIETIGEAARDAGVDAVFEKGAPLAQLLGIMERVAGAAR